MKFRVDLNLFRGPMDLLLYLVKKHEVDLVDVPLAEVTEQYLTYLEIIEQINIDAVGKFLEVAGMLIELKSRHVLPRMEEEEEAVPDDPRDNLVEQLLDYKRFKDASAVLEERSRDWRLRYSRRVNDLPPRKIDPAEQPIHEVELWDLVSAFGRVLRDNRATKPREIVYDDTPIHTYMKHIHRRMVENGKVAFSEIFTSGMHKSAIIGIFLAVLELVRHHAVSAQQDEPHGEIWVLPAENFSEILNIQNISSYEHPQPQVDDIPMGK